MISFNSVINVVLPDSLLVLFLLFFTPWSSMSDNKMDLLLVNCFSVASSTLLASWHCPVTRVALACIGYSCLALETVSISYCCWNKWPQLSALKQYKSITSRFGRSEVWKWVLWVKVRLSTELWSFWRLEAEICFRALSSFYRPPAFLGYGPFLCLQSRLLQPLFLHVSFLCSSHSYLPLVRTPVMKLGQPDTRTISLSPDP